MSLSARIRSTLLGWMLLAPAAATLAQAAEPCPPAAQEPTAAQLGAAAARARDRGVLWRFSKGGHVSYLYGTLHVGQLEWLFPGSAVTGALGMSDAVVLELDMADAEIQGRLMKAMAPQPGTPALPAALTQRLNQRALAECLEPQVLAALSPEMQVIALTMLVGRRDGLHPAFAVDPFLAQVAREAGKTVVALETPEQQLRALLPRSEAERLELVESGLAEMESGQARQVVLRLAQAWASGDLDTLAGYASWCDCVKTPADRAALRRLIDERNPGMADGIVRLHDSGQRIFAAVGSLHMVGPLGLPALLQQRGYLVDRIVLTP